MDSMMKNFAGVPEQQPTSGHVPLGFASSAMGHVPPPFAYAASNHPQHFDLSSMLTGTRDDVNMHGFGLQGMLNDQDVRLQKLEEQVRSVLTCIEKLSIDVETFINKNGPAIAQQPTVQVEGDQEDLTPVLVPFLSVQTKTMATAKTMKVTKCTEDLFLTCLKKRTLVLNMLKTLHTMQELQTFRLTLTPTMKKRKVVDKDGNEIPQPPQVLFPTISRLFIIEGMKKVFPCTNTAERENEKSYKRWIRKRERQAKDYISKILSYFRTNYNTDGTIISRSTSDEASSTSASENKEAANGASDNKEAAKPTRKSKSSTKETTAKKDDDGEELSAASGDSDSDPGNGDDDSYSEMSD